MNIKKLSVIFIVITMLSGCSLANTPETLSTLTAPPTVVVDEPTFSTTAIPTYPPDAAPPVVNIDIAILLSDQDGQLFLFDSATRERHPLSAPGVYLPTIMSQWAYLIAPVRLSPHATQLVIPQPDGGPTWLLDLPTATQSQLSDQALSVTWASDGRQIAFYTPDIAAPEILYTQQVSPTLEPARPLAHLEAKIIAAAWSPTEPHIAVAVSTGELVEGDAAAYVEILLVAAETGEVQSLGLVEVPATSASAWDLAWTSDGHEIWHLLSQRAFSLDAMAFRPLAAPPAPVSTRVQALAPDGSRMAYVAADQRTLWITEYESETDHLTVTLEGRKSITALFWVEEQLLLTTAAPHELTSIWHVNPETGVAIELCDAVYFIGLWPDLIERYTNLARSVESLP